MTPVDLLFDLFLLYYQTQHRNNKSNPSHAAYILPTSQLSLFSVSLRFLSGFLSKQSLLLWSWYFVLSNFCTCIVCVDGRVNVVSVRISTQTWQWGSLTIRSGFLLPFIYAENNSPVSFSPLSALTQCTLMLCLCIDCLVYLRCLPTVCLIMVTHIRCLSLWCFLFVPLHSFALLADARASQTANSLKR